MTTKLAGKICVMGLALVFGLTIPGVATLVDIAPHNVPSDSASFLDVNGSTWTVSYSSIFDPFTRSSLWDGYIGDQQHLVPGELGGAWLSAGVAGTASIYIDMGVSYNVQQVELWNFGGSNTVAYKGGFKDVKIYLGNTSYPTTEVGSCVLPRGQDVGGQPYANYAPEGVINLTSGVSGRYLTISGLNNYGWGELKGLSEIGVLVPEPLTLVILGLGGLVLRRRIA
jgi:hypothetical protein